MFVMKLMTRDPKYTTATSVSIVVNLAVVLLIITHNK